TLARFPCPPRSWLRSFSQGACAHGHYHRWRSSRSELQRRRRRARLPHAPRHSGIGPHRGNAGFGHLGIRAARGSDHARQSNEDLHRGERRLSRVSHPKNARARRSPRIRRPSGRLEAEVPVATRHGYSAGKRELFGLEAGRTPLGIARPHPYLEDARIQVSLTRVELLASTQARSLTILLLHRSFLLQAVVHQFIRFLNSVTCATWCFPRHA